MLFSIYSQTCKWVRSMGFFGEHLGHVITLRGPFLVSRTGDAFSSPPCADSQRPRVYIQNVTVCTRTTRTGVSTCHTTHRTHTPRQQTHIAQTTPQAPHALPHTTSHTTSHGDRDTEKEDRNRETREDERRKTRQEKTRRKRRQDEREEKTEKETRQDKTRQDKTRQDKTRQEKRRQDKTRRKRREIDEREEKTEKETRQDKTREEKTRQDKTRQEKRDERKDDFVEKCLRNLKSARRSSSKCFEKIPFGRNYSSFSFERSESYSVFNCLHDSHSIFRAAGRNSEIFSARTVPLVQLQHDNRLILRFCGLWPCHRTTARCQHSMVGDAFRCHFKIH